MKFEDAPIGARVALVEAMDDERSSEVRCTFYERREGEAIFSDKFAPAYRLRTVQGTPGEKPRFDTGEHRTATEVPRSLPVEPAEGAVWGAL